MNKVIKIGDEVVRSKGDYVVGCVGLILEIDTLKKRAKVNWDKSTTTWVSFNSLELVSIPYEIIPFHYKNKKAVNPKYIKI
jgi:hypothetical protein